MKRDIQTKYYASYYNLDVIKWATHFEFNNGERVKISPQTKLLYEYRLNRYKWFLERGRPYKETNATVSRHLGISKKSIDEVYSKQLRDIGLLTVERVGNKSYEYTVLSLNEVTGGGFINDELVGLDKRKRAISEDTFTYNNMKTLEHNKRVAQRLIHNADEKMTTISIDELGKLYNQLKENITDE